MNLPYPALRGLRVLLADTGQHRSPTIRLELIRLRCQWLDAIDVQTSPGALADALDRLAPDLLMVDCAEPTDALIESVVATQRRQPRPLLLAADQATGEQMRLALLAGVTTLELGGLPPQRLGALLQHCLVRFEHDQTLQRELRQAQTQLADRKLIERARGILMREQGLDEETAFQRLRQLAMDAGQTLAAVAARLIDADHLLRPR